MWSETSYGRCLSAGRLRGCGIVLIGATKGQVLRLILALTLFLGWMSYLGYAALTKSRSPIVSHIQVAAAPYAVVAEVACDPEGKPLALCKVVESLVPGGPARGSDAVIPDLPGASGFDGAGRYLLLLQRVNSFHGAENQAKTPEQPTYSLVGPQRSPGDVSVGGKPMIYRWSDDVRREYETLRR